MTKRIISSTFKQNLFNLGKSGFHKLTYLDKFLLDYEEFDEIRDTWRPNTDYKRKDN